MYRLFSVLIVLMIVASCKKKEAAPDCGCDGSTYATVESVEAGYLGMEFSLSRSLINIIISCTFCHVLGCNMDKEYRCERL